MRKNGAFLECKSCGGEFYVAKNRLEKAKYCSYKCGGDYLRGKPVSAEHLAKLREGFKRRIIPTQFKKGHIPWHKDVAVKGNKASYSAIHWWIRRRKGSAKECRMCRIPNAKRYEWANINHKYSRTLEDYVALCGVCHRKFDKAMETNRARWIELRALVLV